MGKLHKKGGKGPGKHEKEAFILQMGLPVQLSLWTERISTESPGSMALYSRQLQNLQLPKLKHVHPTQASPFSRNLC